MYWNLIIAIMLIFCMVVSLIVAVVFVLKKNYIKHSFLKFMVCLFLFALYLVAGAYFIAGVIMNEVGNYWAEILIIIFPLFFIASPSFRSDIMGNKMRQKKMNEFKRDVDFNHSVAELSEKQGRWIYGETETGTLEIYCPLCGGPALYPEEEYRPLETNFCPHCGARMDDSVPYDLSWPFAKMSKRRIESQIK